MGKKSCWVAQIPEVVLAVVGGVILIATFVTASVFFLGLGIAVAMTFALGNSFPVAVRILVPPVAFGLACMLAYIPWDVLLGPQISGQ